MLPLPPGPPPLTGIRAYWRSPPEFLYELARDYGDVVRWRGVITAYVINHPDYVRQVLTQSFPRFVKDTIDYRVLAQTLGRGLVTSEGELWARQRKLMQPMFNNRSVSNFDAAINETATQLIQRWADKPAGTTLWLEREMGRVGFQIVGHTLFGVDIDCYADEIADILEVVNTHPQTLRAMLTLYPWLPLPSNRRFQHIRQRLDDIVYSLIDARRRRGENRGDILDRLLAARDEDTGEGMSEIQMRDEIVTLMLAGHETTATALVWTLYLLSQHPETEMRLVAELEATLAGAAASSSDLARLPYLKQVVQESLRLYPPVWAIARQNSEEIEFGGCRIPPKSYLVIPIYALHRHPDFWKNPMRFDPERFAPQRVETRHSYCYLPFSAGPRTCIGAGMSMLEIQLVLVQILQRFCVHPVHGHPVSTLAAVTFKPKFGLPVTITPRHPGNT